jgi:cell shape-determining protein MreC
VNANAEHLKEQIVELKAKIERAEQWQTKYNDLKIEHEKYVESEANKWFGSSEIVVTL